MKRGGGGEEGKFTDQLWLSFKSWEMEMSQVRKTDKIARAQECIKTGG